MPEPRDKYDGEWGLPNLDHFYRIDGERVTIAFIATKATMHAPFPDVGTLRAWIDAGLLTRRSPAPENERDPT